MLRMLPFKVKVRVQSLCCHRCYHTSTYHIPYNFFLYLIPNSNVENEKVAADGIFQWKKLALELTFNLLIWDPNFTIFLDGIPTSYVQWVGKKIPPKRVPSEQSGAGRADNWSASCDTMSQPATPAPPKCHYMPSQTKHTMSGHDEEMYFPFQLSVTHHGTDKCEAHFCSRISEI